MSEVNEKCSSCGCDLQPVVINWSLQGNTTRKQCLNPNCKTNQFYHDESIKKIEEV